MRTVSTSSLHLMSCMSFENFVTLTGHVPPAIIEITSSFKPSKFISMYVATLSYAPVVAQKFTHTPESIACITEFGLNIEGSFPI